MTVYYIFLNMEKILKIIHIFLINKYQMPPISSMFHFQIKTRSVEQNIYTEPLEDVQHISENANNTNHVTERYHCICMCITKYNCGTGMYWYLENSLLS